MDERNMTLNLSERINLECVSNSTDFRNLENEWNALTDTCHTPLQGFEWFEACLQANQENSDLSVLVLRIDGIVSAIAPLVVDRSGATPILRSLDYFAFEVNHFVYSDEKALAPLCAGIFELGLPLLLEKMRIDSAEMRHLCGASRGKGLVVRRNRNGLNYVPLAPEWSTLEQSMSSSRRSYLRRRRRIAERSGRLRFDVVSPDVASVDRHLEELIHVEGASWKAKAGTAMIKDHRMRKLITSFGRATARLGTLRIFYLRIGDATAAARMTVEKFGRLWEFKIGYDERWATASPGNLLMNEVLRYACERGLKGYEFLGGEEPWHHYWPIKARACESIRYYPPSISGGIQLLQDAGKFTGLRSRQALSYIGTRLVKPY